MGCTHAPKPGPGSTHDTWELRFPGGQCHRHQLLQGGTFAWHGPVPHAYHFSPATAEDAYTQQCHWRVPVPGTHSQTATLHMALMRVERLLEKINLRVEEKAFLRQQSASAELRATASQAELLPRLHLQKANKQNCLRSENTASSLKRHFISLPGKEGRRNKAACPSVPEPVSSPGNDTWLLGGSPGTGEGLHNTPESCSLDNMWHPSSSSKGAEPPALRDWLLQEPGMRAKGLKCLAGEGPWRRKTPTLLN